MSPKVSGFSVEMASGRLFVRLMTAGRGSVSTSEDEGRISVDAVVDQYGRGARWRRAWPGS